MTKRESSDYVPLSNLSFHILLALGSGPAHGYAIGREVEERSGGKLSPTTGALYQALRRLSEEGLIEFAPKEKGVDERRQYFRLTRLGRRVVAAEARRLDELVSLARSRRLYRGST